MGIHVTLFMEFMETILVEESENQKSFTEFDLIITSCY